MAKRGNPNLPLSERHRRLGAALGQIAKKYAREQESWGAAFLRQRVEIAFNLGTMLGISLAARYPDIAAGLADAYTRRTGTGLMIEWRIWLEDNPELIEEAIRSFYGEDEDE